MKSSLAFMGAVLVVFATGALLTKAIETHYGTNTSHPKLFSVEYWTQEATEPERAKTRGFAPDSIALGRISGAFVPNLGQAKHDVYFQLIADDLTAHFRATTIAIHPGGHRLTARESSEQVTIRFIGANYRPEVEATSQSSTRMSYVGGGESDTFTATVPLFSELTYSELYDGVNLRVAATRSGVVRRFALQAGTAASTVLLHYDGAQEPVLLSSGRLKITSGTMILTYDAPEAFQIIDGTRTPVPVAFAMGRYGAFGFEVGAYDEELPLVIEVGGV